MESIIIPSSVTSIENAAFSMCISLIDCYCYANNPPGSSQFMKIEGSTLHVPAGCKTAYENSDWKDDFTNIVEMN